MTDPLRDRASDRWIGAIVAGRFRVDAPIGAGAMGRVYRGEQLSVGEPVAIKLLHDHLGRDPRVGKRFDREARAASRLSHPSSVKILDFGEAEDGTLYIAMELLEGDDLQAIIDSDAPLAPARIGDLMVQTLRALDQAHAAGIVHRDLKPENVVVIEDAEGRERVKVCDFGIAKIVEGDSKITAITKDGYICGTPEYMAPEQARGEIIDARTDVYAAGVMLYQMLTGGVPFRAQSALGVITKHVKEAPLPPRQARPEWSIPEPLERVALTALAKRPDDRYASAAAMADAIERALAELPPSTGDAASTTGGPAVTSAPLAEAAPADGRGWYVALAFAVALLAFGVWLWVAG